MTRWSLFLQTLSLLLHHFLGLYSSWDSTDAGGAYFYFPDRDSGSTVCRYDWFLRLKSERYGVRISLRIEFDGPEKPRMSAHVSLGPEFYGANHLISRRVEQRSVHEFTRVIEESIRVAQDAGVTRYFPVLHISLPNGGLVSASVQNEHGAIFASRLDKQTSKQIAVESQEVV